MKQKITNMLIGTFLPIVVVTTTMSAIAGIIAALTPATFQDCTSTGVFWVVYLVYWLGLTIYVNSEILND
jgi:hypothetical protein